MLQGMTAHYLVHSSYPLKKGETCLVHAAAGGVGLLLCQMAKRLGARVIGPALAQSVVEAFLQATFSGEERHVRRLKKIAALEARQWE